ncbi:MAG TPA: cytochrome-c oxidase, cbb3-type subunit III [Rudaea sp.]|nr:cytochrome-c oxidase, cbb3-type subunit III [Rudaea sp.]
MNAFWSWFISALTIASIVALVWLLVVTARTPSTGATTGHVWDEGLTEYNHPLPRWWLGLFLLSVLFGAGYLVFYPGLGSNTGALGWTSGKEVAAELAENNRKLDAVFAQFRNRPIEELEHDPKALSLGRNVFANNCAVCHGSDARGAKGYPNLADDDWLYGGQPDTVLTSVLKGRQGVMPPLGAALGAKGVDEVANYVLSLSGHHVDASLAEAGKARYMTICIACHGLEGKGSPVIGAPNLTDNVWLYGGSLDEVKASIRDGRSGKMPSWEPVLGADRARLVAAWVLAQSQSAKASGAPAP